MPALDSKLRSQLDDVCQKARDLSVAYALSALQKRAVDAAEPLSYFGPKDKELRNRLRARGRQAGDVRNADKTQSIEQLAQELAYEYWHRMLFARFLAENNLLMHPDGVAVSLEECEELAPTADPPAVNGFVLAARYASTMLPQIFRTDDVLLEIEFAPEQRLALEKLLASVPKQTFEADDSLGWVYQFWQTAEKKRVNESGDKIDAHTLPAVTQLFTEHYMVEFLLHNTIGAWWCAKEGIQGPPGGAGIPAGKSPVEMEYLRWRDDGTPAADKFEGWPKTLAEFRMLDPCCGSGHFLVAAFTLLVPLRIHDEKLTAEQACEAVLRDNMFGLELDPRCTQIAAFALALAAWKYPDAGGYRSLPTLNIACSGQGVTGKKEEWLALANGDDKLRSGMDRLYDLFQQAPNLGSLIDPRREKGDLFEAGFAELQPLLSKALARQIGDVDLAAIGVAAQGIACACDILAKTHTLIATNVPYLGRVNQGDLLREWCDSNCTKSKQDLATVFVERILRLLVPSGTIAVVTPQNWWFLSSYKSFRKEFLENIEFQLASALGEEAWITFGKRGPLTVMLIANNKKPTETHHFSAIDASKVLSIADKISILSDTFDAKPLDGKSRPYPILRLSQREQIGNPDHRIVLSKGIGGTLLEEFAECLQGISPADIPQFVRLFWEHEEWPTGWKRMQTSFEGTAAYDGKTCVLDFTSLEKNARTLGAAIRGKSAWGRIGVSVSKMRHLPVSIYTGDLFDANAHVILPKAKDDALPIWTFCSSNEYKKLVRDIDKKTDVTNATMVKVPFDIALWRSEAAKLYPSGLPALESNDPAQWLFNGDISSSTDPLQVAVVRLLGYRWPEQPKTTDTIDKLADSDGILCLPSVRGEAAAAERLIETLHEAYGSNWSDAVLHKLLTDAGGKAGSTLDDWLRNKFFEQHCKRFHSRPFIWHIWDGRKDGFSALLNYHKLDYKSLENLTYAYLGNWIKSQTSDAKADKTGAGERLAAAQELQAKLKLILAGEPPFDIFVRWKPLHEQAIGWHPDLNAGVRMNTRPFIEADILRKKPNIKWTKDRGGEPERDKNDFPWFWSGNDLIEDRVNDIHLTNAEKQAARSRKKGAK